ncbi:rhamnogalacturonan acetylesterase [Jeotgalibaca sp. MA1X17-3]|uniref:rhamnogalacturonan acetylesterase n=1 Tax=Jeotgalibaca sp. MA1X17-3 TaxID=2908211 RepID=UPI001F1980F8|nr:rhamnogalacturonan acetylesterase [Jeotgalibaca sp. MA1X17-3]UJF15673.1 rhamnogalacturonan acetylesterase [Jeotgalibaca sp. MA1X17-3]
MNERKPVIFIVGDSTAATKLPEKKPEAGWGEYLHEYFNSEITIQNDAMNGRSTKSFLEEGLFSEVEKKFQRGDYLFIQFGHNDQKLEDSSRYTQPFSEYQDNLKWMVQAAREKEVEPFIFSSVTRRAFEQSQVDQTNLGEYPQAALELAKKMNIKGIDIFSKSCSLLNKLGEEHSQLLFLHLEPEKNVNYPEGVADNTHFNERGAKMIAELVAQELKEQSTSLQKYIK